MFENEHMFSSWLYHAHICQASVQLVTGETWQVCHWLERIHYKFSVLGKLLLDLPAQSFLVLGPSRSLTVFFSLMTLSCETAVPFRVRTASNFISIHSTLLLFGLRFKWYTLYINMEWRKSSYHLINPIVQFKSGGVVCCNLAVSHWLTIFSANYECRLICEWYIESLLRPVDSWRETVWVFPAR
jgi:hypothetical protein